MTTGTTTTPTRDAREPDSRPLRTLVRQLVMAGFSVGEAVSLAGLSIGLRPVSSGWSLRDIERLRFLRHLVATGRVAA